MKILDIKLLVYLVFLGFIVSCVPPKATKSGGSNQDPPPSVTPPVVTLADCASLEISKCETDPTKCKKSRDTFTCVAIPATCSEISADLDCPYLKPDCEWKTGTGCVEKIAASATGAGTVTDPTKFAGFNETQLKEALAKVAYKDQDAFIDEIITTNSLKNLVINNKFAPDFISYIGNKNSNKILTAGLDDANLSKEAKIDLVKNIFKPSDAMPRAMLALINPSKIQPQGADIYNGVINDNNEKNNVADKLTKLFALGDEAIDMFYNSLKVATTESFTKALENNNMHSGAVSIILNLIIEKGMINQIVTKDKHIGDMMNVINKSSISRTTAKNGILAPNKPLGQKIVDAITDVDLKQKLQAKVNALP